MKALYGLKQAPKLWYDSINGFLNALGFMSSPEDCNLYMKNGVLLILYADDMLLAHDKYNATGEWVREMLSLKYNMTDLGTARYFLGIECVVRRFSLESSKSTRRPTDCNVLLDNPDCKTLKLAKSFTCHWFLLDLSGSRLSIWFRFQKLL